MCILFPYWFISKLPLTSKKVARFPFFYRQLTHVVAGTLYDILLHVYYSVMTKFPFTTKKFHVFHFWSKTTHFVTETVYAKCVYTVHVTADEQSFPFPLPREKLQIFHILIKNLLILCIHFSRYCIEQMSFCLNSSSTFPFFWSKT